MRKVSEMYRRSGGTCWQHTCSECADYIFGKKYGKCRNYELDAPWNPNFIACKFFTVEHEEELKGQMNIFDFVK